MKLEAEIAEKYHELKNEMDERARRIWAGTEARAAKDRGGIRLVARATGLSPITVRKAVREIKQGLAPSLRVRRPGAGRKRKVDLEPGLRTAVEALVEPATRGDPEAPLRWSSKSTRKLAKELKPQGYQVSHRLVAALLHDLGYSLQANRKTREGSQHPDRNAQFEHINRRTALALAAGQPVISVDTKKKELVGDFKNAGREWRPKGEPEPVRVHDFLDSKLGKAIPYGIYDLGRNLGWVSVGVDHDTAQFAVNTIRSWWRKMGLPAYRNATRLLIVADGGGSNGSRVRLWKWELQKLADATGLEISVCHLPPGTSKWNKIEHRLFSFISQNWRGQPLLTHAAIVQLIGNTRTNTGLKVRCLLDEKHYPPQVSVTAAQFDSIAIYPARFHGEWNYTIRPRNLSR